MANDELTVVIADESVRTLTSRDAGSGIQSQRVDVGPWMPTVVSGAQYNLTISTSAVTLTVPSTATHVLFTVDGADVRFTEDGSTPTATNGLLLRDGTIVELPLPNALKLIRAAAVDAKVNATYRKYV